VIKRMAVGDSKLLINHKDTSTENFTCSKKKVQQQIQIQIILTTKLIMSFIAAMNFYSMNACCCFSKDYCSDDAAMMIPYRITFAFRISCRQLLMSQLSMQVCSS